MRLISKEATLLAINEALEKQAKSASQVAEVRVTTFVTVVVKHSLQYLHTTQSSSRDTGRGVILVMLILCGFLL